MKKIFKRVLIILISLMCILSIYNFNSYADDDATTGEAAISEFLDTEGDVDKGDGSVTKYTSNYIGSIIRILQIVFLGLAVIMLMALGIKYMGSSIEERAEIKKHLVYYVLGVMLLFSAATLVTILRDFFVNYFK